MKLTQPKTQSQIIKSLEDIVYQRLYVSKWQAFDAFTYFIKYPKSTIQNPTSKDYQLRTLVLLVESTTIIGWAVEVFFEETPKNEYSTWVFVHPNYRHKGLSKKLLKDLST